MPEERTGAARKTGIDGAKRAFHGALLDAEILADIYTAMTRCRENPIRERKG
ncbi:MAG: hypothetical protein LBD06_13280 [Candidatus Accumulibacter sp.]|nr:hypothetical protein [Accumulibacter sp.]